MTIFKTVQTVLNSIFQAGSIPDRPAPPDHDIIAIGDIHGRLDLLNRLFDKLGTLALNRDTEIIILGDYIDRGPQSAGVIDCLLDHPFLQDRPVVFLKGNHEASLLEFLSNPQIGRNWLQYGGGETLLSYGVTTPPGVQDLEYWQTLSHDLNQAIPHRHKQFYQSLELSAERGCYLFVHAGVDPQIPLADQTEAQLLWIRDGFLSDTQALERIIVHGHTPQPAPSIDDRRIGLDTGAYQTGQLSVAWIKGDRVDFLTS